MTTDERILHTLVLSGQTWTIEELRRLLQVPRRDVEAGIESLRLAGNPIIADAHGVRVTNDPDELAAYLEARRRRLVTIYAGNRALRKTLRAMQERTALTLFGDVAS
jgi:biotin operon repressor